MKEKYKVLIVEDDHEHFTLIERSIKGASYRVEIFHADSIQSALSYLEKEVPDILLTDWKLPDGEGIEFLAQTEIKEQVPVVLMTSFGNEEMAVKAMKAGAIDYIVKSLNLFNELPHIINRIIREWKSQKILEIKEKALAVSEERLRNILENSPFGMFEIDKEYNIAYSNKTMLKLLDYAESDIFVFDDLIFEKNKEDVLFHINQVFESGESARFTAKLKKKSGKILPVEIQLSVFSYLDTRKMIITISDNTEKIRIEEYQLKENKLNSIGILAGGIAHDFNNILSAILGNVSLVKYSLNENDEAMSLILDAEKACNRAKNLTQQLLTFSKGGSPVKEETNIEEIIQESAKFVIRGSNCYCNFIINPDIWSVQVDKGQLSQVIQNIVLNAIQSMPSGGQILIKISNFKRDNENIPGLYHNKYVKISIQDQGIGITEEDLKHIFDPYYTTKETGNGLGLTICYSIIKQHNGIIDVSSEKHKGTNFNIYLPASNQSSSSIKDREAQIEENHPNARILLMDDDSMVRNMVSRILHRFNYQVEYVNEGNQLIDAYKKSLMLDNPFDLIITDLTIQGGMGGREAVEILHRIHPKIKCIVMSGYSNDPVLANYESYGFSARISKPFSINDFITIIQKVLAQA